MSRNTPDLQRRTARALLGPALAELVDAAATLRAMSPAEWVDSRLRAAILAELGHACPDLAEPHVLPLLYWASGHSPLDPEALPDADELAGALGFAVAGTARRTRGKRRTTEPMDCPFYDAEALQAALARVRDDDQRHHFRALERSGPTRLLQPVEPTQERSLLALLALAPHLREATESVLGAMAIARRGKSPLRQAPILLSGQPATGKTWWANRVAEALGVPCIRIVMPKVTASFALSGSSGAWSNSRPGRIVQEFMAIESATPILILDEVDKVATGNYDPAPVLLDLLEPGSACRWRDEFFDMEFDVSRAIVIATANRPQDMDPALRSRFREILVPPLARRELPAVIQSVWEEHRKRYPGLRLPVELPTPAMEGLVSCFTTIRALQHAFETAVAQAARRPGRLRLLASDLVGGNPLKAVRE